MGGGLMLFSESLYKTVRVTWVIPITAPEVAATVMTFGPKEASEGELRTILINLLLSVGSGKPVTA
jgi:hypothetical protein